MKKYGKRAMAALMVLFLAFCLIMGVRDELDRRRGAEQYTAARETAGLTAAPPPPEPRKAPMPEEPEAPPEPVLPDPRDPHAAALAGIDLAALREKNPDVAGWIEIPDTAISYPLIQGEDNDEYLRRTWLGEKASMGSIFIECANSRDMDDFHTIIYGHRMRDGTMFADLGKYQEADFWREHPSVYLVLDGGVRRYDIFAAYETGTRSLVYRLDLDGREEELIQFGLDSSALETDVVPAADEKIITLSTCTGNGYSSRWVVQAVLREVVSAEQE